MRNGGNFPVSLPKRGEKEKSARKDLTIGEFFVIIINAFTSISNIAASPSGKATDSDSVIS